MNINDCSRWPEIRKARALEGGRAFLVQTIRLAPTNVRRHVVAEIMELGKSRFMTPFQSWGAVLGVLERHLPKLADEARLFVAEMAAIECDSTA